MLLLLLFLYLSTKPFTMKKLYFLALTSLICINEAFSQNNGNGNNSENGQNNALVHWKLNGNQATNSHFFGTTNESDLIFKTFNLERLRISKDGEIIFPQFLSMEGETRILGVDEAGKTKAITAKGLLTQMYQNDCFVKEPLGGGSVTYPAPSWANKVGIDEAGILYTGTGCPAQVGINTADPKATLHVGGTGYFSSYVSIGTVPTFNQALSIKATQKDGIKLDLNTSSTANKTAFEININNTNPKIFSAKNSISGKSIFQIYGDGKVELNSSNDNNGLLVINNSNGNPVYNVFGNGKVWAQEMRITVQNPWGDFVFEKDYRLISIKELEEFIKSYKHLPNIPSASQIETEGLDIAEIQRLQMIKIEELTMYIIQLKAEIEKLKEASK